MTDAHGVARDQLRAFIERIERLSEEAKTIADDIRDVKSEAKSMGFSVKAINEIIKLRKKDENERAEEEAILDAYKAALGMIPQIELFDQEEVKPASRDERRRQLMSEDMAEHKNLVDEMADLGMISEEARHENKALADGAATKFGNGPAQALQSPRQAAEAVSERAVINPVANVEEGATGAIAAASNDPASRTDEGGERQHSSRVGFADDCRTGGKEQSDASAAPVGDAAADAHGIPEPNSPETATEKTAPHEVADVNSLDRVSPQATSATTGSVGANTGGGHVADGRNTQPDQAGGLVHRPPAKPLRPHCLKPDACGGYGSNHCFSCKKAAKAEEVAA